MSFKFILVSYIYVYLISDTTCHIDYYKNYYPSVNFLFMFDSFPKRLTKRDYFYDTVFTH